MALVIGILLAGCATGPSGGPPAAKSQGDLLKDAGFRAHTPNSPQKLSYVKTLPAKKVVMNQHQGQVLYLVCPDPDSPQCYLGDKAAYQRYQQLAIQHSLAEDQHKVSEDRWDPEALQMWTDAHGGG
ncbi:MAG: hypothetical protein C4567_09480 [Deltaproteobacteria bacterium]|nr:MAG: hypothetical protein C4567_09480 [Deltaproteobacteria bacterium]